MSDETLREHKREAFDAMVAYHQSEISHTYHAITMMVAVVGLAGAGVFALVVADSRPKHLDLLAWGLFGVVSGLLVVIASTVHRKINQDHERHADRRLQWNRASSLLGVFDQVTIDGEATHVAEWTGPGEGHKETQLIVWAFAVMVVLLALLFALFVTLTDFAST